VWLTSRKTGNIAENKSKDEVRLSHPAGFNAKIKREPLALKNYIFKLNY